MATDTDGAGERLLRGPDGRVLAVLAVAAMAVVASRLVLSPVLPGVIREFGVTPAGAGLALTVMLALVGLVRFPAGRLADAWSRKTVLVAALGTCVAGALLVSTAPTYPAFVGGAAVTGVGIGLYFPAAIGAISDRFVSRRSAAFGVHEAAINVGGVVAAGPVYALAAGGWRRVYAPVVVALALVALALHAVDRSPYVVGPVALDARETATRVFGAAATRRVVLAFGALSFVNEATLAFLPTFLRVDHGFAPAVASDAFAWYFVVAIPVTLVAGTVGDRAGPARVAAAGAAVAAAGLLALVAGPSTLPAALLGVALLAVGLAGNWPVLLAVLVRTLPLESRGGDFGAISTVGIAIGSLGPTYLGAVAQELDYGAAFAGLVAVLAAYAALSLGLRR
ncbi:MAG: MFS transporter [Halobacteriaceae archaeon]